MKSMPVLVRAVAFGVVFLFAAPAVAGGASAPRAELVERIIAIAEAAVANPEFLADDRWSRFKDVLRDHEMQVLDDVEFRDAFNRAARDLPFSHFKLFWNRPSGPDGGSGEIELEWPRDGVALLRITAFDLAPARIAEVLNEMLDRTPETLIIDLRGNPGGSFPSAVALSRYLTRDTLDAGAFLTRGWFERHGDYPDAAQYAAIDPVETLQLGAFVEQLRRDGAARLVIPAHDGPVFDGRVLLLTDGNTASTAEPLAYRLQQRGIPVIGARTAGAMLSGERFPVDETFTLFLPVADYVAPDLVRLDQRGVAPDIEVAGHLALERALIELGLSDGS